MDRRHGHVCQGHDGGAARGVVDQRHFAENAIRAESFEATVPEPDLYLSTHDNKELVALFALYVTSFGVLLLYEELLLAAIVLTPCIVVSIIYFNGQI